MSGLTQNIVQFIQDFDSFTLDPKAYEIAKMGIVDSIACMFAGANEPVVDILAKHYQQSQGQGNSSVPILFLSGFLPIGQAACIWGTAGHALDYDDVAMSAHPSTVLMPAVATSAYALNSSGLNLLKAYIVGYEIWAELFVREIDPFHIKGWHPTAVFGTVAAAGALAYLHRLTSEQTSYALGIAASMASGLVANFGTMTKPLHAGRAASLAYEAVELAKLGLTSCTDVLEHKAGFLNAISPKGNVNKNEASEYLGKKLRLLELGLNIKQYPVCYSSHRVIDGILTITQNENFNIEDIENITATIGAAQASMLRNPCPETGLEAKFSLEFAIASALLVRKVGLLELTDAFVRQETLREIYKKIRIQITDELCPMDPAFSLNDRVVITLCDGRVFDSGNIRFPMGHARLPLSEDKLREKFIECLQLWKTKNDSSINVNAMYQKLFDLEKQNSLQAIFK